MRSTSRRNKKATAFQPPFCTLRRLRRLRRRVCSVLPPRGSHVAPPFHFFKTNAREKMTMSGDGLVYTLLLFLLVAVVLYFLLRRRRASASEATSKGRETLSLQALRSEGSLLDAKDVPPGTVPKSRVIQKNEKKSKKEIARWLQERITQRLQKLEREKMRQSKAGETIETIWRI